MKQIIPVLKNFFIKASEEIDIFKSQIFLQINEKNKVSTKTGAIFSLSIMIFLIVVFSKSDIFEKKSPRVLSSNFPSKLREGVQLKSRILAIGLQNDVGEGLIDENIYTVRVKLLSKNETTEFDVIEEIYDVHECQKDDFKNNNLYEELNLKYNYCFNNNASFNLEGYWDERKLSYLTIELIICENKTFDGACKSLQEIKKFIKKQNNFNIYFENIIVDPLDYLNPLKTVIQNEYNLVDINYKKIVELTFKNVYISTNKGFLFDDNDDVNDVSLDDKKIDFFLIEDIIQEASLFRFEIYAAKNVFRMERNYEKLSDLMAKLGGILKLLMAMSYFFINLELKYSLTKIFLKSLFRLPSLKKKDKIYGKNTFVSPFDFSMIEFNLMMFKRIFGFRMSKKESILNRGNRKLGKKIDIIQILRKIQEIKSIKKLIFNADQLLLFKTRSKPPLSIRSENDRFFQKNFGESAFPINDKNFPNSNGKAESKFLEMDQNSFDQKNKFNLKKTILQFS